MPLLNVLCWQSYCLMIYKKPILIYAFLYANKIDTLIINLEYIVAPLGGILANDIKRKTWQFTSSAHTFTGTSLVVIRSKRLVLKSNSFANV